MDTSETYVKMRLAAIPDLGMGTPPEAVDEDIITGGDTYLGQEDDIFIDAKGNWYYSSGNEACQLERQDQLQEMVGIELEPFLKLTKWCLDISFKMTTHPTTEQPYWYKFTSMRTLWLAFVMHEKYQKVWNGETWVKETSS